MITATSALSAQSGISSALAEVAGSAGPNGASGNGSTTAPFADLFTEAVGQVQDLDDKARTAVSGLMTGSGVDVHQAMIATEKASMAFELALSVRNKAVQAYQQVVGMQF